MQQCELRAEFPDANTGDLLSICVKCNFRVFSIAPHWIAFQELYSEGWRLVSQDLRKQRCFFNIPVHWLRQALVPPCPIKHILVERGFLESWMKSTAPISEIKMEDDQYLIFPLCTYKCVLTIIYLLFFTYCYLLTVIYLLLCTHCCVLTIVYLLLCTYYLRVVGLESLF